jgi:hypothetical protein
MVTSSRAENVGKRLGRMWLRLVRREKHVVSWLVGQGLSTSMAQATIWVVRLVFLAAVFYVSVMLAVLVAAFLIVAMAVSHADLSVDEDRAEWRDGLLGFGLYNRDGFRIDPHDPNEEQ